MSFWEKFDFIWNVTWNDFCAFIPAGQIPILATTLGIHYFSSFFQKKKKQKKNSREQFHAVTNL